MRIPRLPTLLLTLLAVLLVACGAEDASPPMVVATAPATATAAPTPEPTPEPTPPPTPTTAPAVAPTPVATVVRPAGPPSVGRWIDVDVTRFTVRLMDGQSTLREIGPIGVGREIDTGRYESTQTGLFAVYTKRAEQTYDAPYDTYIAWWVGFDSAKDNGFHSFLLDAEGNVEDASTGRVSNGCIRTGEGQAIYEFAEIGTPVWVHV
jgi:hypothetical protein